MEATVPIAELEVDRFASASFRDFVLSTEYGRCAGYTALGRLPWISNPSVELFYRAPDEVLLRFVAKGPLRPETFDEVLVICQWMTAHSDRVHAAIRAIHPAQPPSDALSLSLKLISAGFSDNWRGHIRLLPYATEVLQLGLATDALGRPCVIKRSDTFARRDRAKERLKRGIALGRVRKRKDQRPHEHEPSPQVKIVLGEPLRRTPRIKGYVTEVREIEALLWRVLPDPSMMRTQSAGPPSDLLRLDSDLGVYAGLVALAARLLFAQTPSHGSTITSTRGFSESHARQLLGDVLPLLGSVATYFAKASTDVFARKIPEAFWPATIDATRRRLALKYLPKRYTSLSANWNGSVPSTFAAFLEEMVPSTIDLRQEIGSEQDLQKSGSPILGNASIGVIAAVHATSVCDMLWRHLKPFRAPAFTGMMTPRGKFDPVPALEFLRADLVRVVCAHRVMLEMAGLPDRAIAVAMLCDAASVAEELRTKITYDNRDDVARGELMCAAQESLAVLRGGGTLRKRGKQDSEQLQLCMTQERVTRRFFAAVP
jgi:hypothetical protein